MTDPGSATPSDELPDVLATGRGRATTLFTSLSARHPDGRDAEYLRWHGLDHAPEQHRLDGLVGAFRFVSTPAGRAVRAAEDDRYEATDHVMTYLFTGPSALGPFRGLGAALGAGGRMGPRLPRVALEAGMVTGRAVDPAVHVGVDVLPWRPATGVYLLVEAGPTIGGEELVGVDGVAGAWWATADPTRPLAAWATGPAGGDRPRQWTYAFLDDDPVAVARRLRPVVERRWTASGPVPLLAAPFHTVVPFAWDRHLP